MPKGVFPRKNRHGHPGPQHSCRACATDRSRCYRARYPEKIAERNRRWREQHPERMKTAVAKWQTEHRKERTDIENVRRARKAGATVERVYRSIVFKRDTGLCGECGITVDPNNWHLDHVVPLSKGGAHSYANTQVAHPVCNQKKGSK